MHVTYTGLRHTGIDKVISLNDHPPLAIRDVTQGRAFDPIALRLPQHITYKHLHSLH